MIAPTNHSRKSNVSLDSLAPNKQYVATIYADAKDTEWKENPMTYEIKSYLVNDKTTLKIALAKGGGGGCKYQNGFGFEKVEKLLKRFDWSERHPYLQTSPKTA